MMFVLAGYTMMICSVLVIVNRTINLIAMLKDYFDN